jgi:uncharacterized protein (TIGR03435 family)
LPLQFAENILEPMFFARPALVLFLLGTLASAQSQRTTPSFEVASVRPVQNPVGPDYNNQITYSPGGFTGRNVTLKRLVAEAWHCQIDQVSGPPWLDHSEYDITARAPQGSNSEQIHLMLRALLAERFQLKQHSETRQMRVYELAIAKGGPKIQPASPGSESAAGSGFHFRGDMRQFADFLALQFSIPAPVSPGTPVKAGGPLIPVLDKTDLQGIYEFNVNRPPELGTDSFTGWKRALEEQFGLKIESQKDNVAIVVVDDAAKTPTAN